MAGMRFGVWSPRLAVVSAVLVVAAGLAVVPVVVPVVVPEAAAQGSGQWSTPLNNVAGSASCGVVASVSTPSPVSFQCPAGGLVSYPTWPGASVWASSPESSLGVFQDTGSGSSIGPYVAWNAASGSTAYRVVRFEPGIAWGMSMIALGQPGSCVTVNLAAYAGPMGVALQLNRGSSGGVVPKWGPMLSPGRFHVLGLRVSGASAELLVDGVVKATSGINGGCAASQYWFHVTTTEPMSRTVAMWSSATAPGFVGSVFDVGSPPVPGGWSALLNTTAGVASCGAAANLSSPFTVLFPCPAGGPGVYVWPPAASSTPSSPEPSTMGVFRNPGGGYEVGFLGWSNVVGTRPYRVVRFGQNSLSGWSLIALGDPGACVRV